MVLRANRQALGRLPWFAAFFLRARRLRPVLPMVFLLESLSRPTTLPGVGPVDEIAIVPHEMVVDLFVEQPFRRGLSRRREIRGG